MNRFVTHFARSLITLSLTVSIAHAIPRAQIKASDFVAELDRSGKLEPVFAMMDARLKELVPDDVLRAGLTQRLRAIQKSKDYRSLDHFPVIPMNAINVLRPALGGLGGAKDAEVKVTQKVSGALEDLLGGECTEVAPAPKAVSAQLPGLSDGHFPDESLDKCVVHQSLRLAKVLNALLRRDGSRVTIGGRDVNTATELFVELLRTHHRIDVRNERTYANFLSLNAGENPVIWPVWIDTGLKTEAGEAVKIPVGHSQHAWYIEGPLVKARVAFYLGVSGVGFFAQVEQRPAWTGLRASYTLNSKQNEERILGTVSFADRYYQRVQREVGLYAKDLPADGYGYLGVCNDSNAVLEMATRGTVTTYPLMRAPELDTKADQDDGLDRLIQQLPKDSDTVHGDRHDILKRIQAMFPFDSTDSPALHDEPLRDVMKSIEQELK